MSVKGFNIEGTIHKYDFNALENIPIEISGSDFQPVQWTNTQIGLLNELFAHLKYDTSTANEIAEQLIDSLLEKSEWDKSQVNLFDFILTHVKYTDDSGGEYADALISALRGKSGKTVVIPDSANDIGAVAENQGVENAGKFLVVGSDGNITTVTMTAWQGGNY